MTGIYFSGTGNSKYALEIFLKEFHAQENIFSIEEAAAVSSIKRHKAILFSYPVQFSNIPKIVRDFVTANAGLWKGKKVFVIATMGLFSGDGAGGAGAAAEKVWRSGSRRSACKNAGQYSR